jgi:hypothetical protein
MWIRLYSPLQDITTSALLLILNSTRSTDISNLVKGLSGDHQDRLMAYLYKVGTTRGVRVIACELIRLSTCAFRGWPTWARRARSAVRSCCRGTKRYVSMRYPSSLIALNPQLVFILADRGRRRRLHRPCHDRSTHRLKDVSANAASLSVVLWYTKCILPNSHHIES